MTFIRNKEDFICENCGFSAKGSGYTNHCPQCLWSKHVDISPGDRKSLCRGMMKPTAVEKKGKEYSIIHRCEVCGAEKINKTSKEDNFDMVVQISAESGE